MNNCEQNQTDRQDFGNVLERELDAALSKYASVEPRPGLENRILASLQTERSRVPVRAWWRWGAAAAFASLIVVVALLAWRQSRPSRPMAMEHPSATEQSSPTTAPMVASNAIPPRVVAPRRKAPSQRQGPAVLPAAPKLDQFPSPQPLSKEELALAHYVREFPREATLIAQAQEQFELDVQKEMYNAGSETRISGSIQHER